MIKLGIIGYSKLNGHPYSFSGIINGINKYYFKNYANWPFIYEYLIKNKKKTRFQRHEDNPCMDTELYLNKKNCKRMSNQKRLLIIERNEPRH